MKKGLCVLMVLLLMLMGTAALAAEMTLALEENEYVSQIIAYGDEALAMVNDDFSMSIRHIKDGGMTEILLQEDMYYSSNYKKLPAEEKARLDALVSLLLPGDDGLYAYAMYGQQLYKWDGTQLAPVGNPLEGDMFWSEGEGESYPNGLQGCIVGGKLLAIFPGDESTDYCPVLYTFDLATGASQKLDIEGLDYVQDVAVYKDGQALLCYQDPNNDYRMCIRALDVNTGMLAEEAFAVMEGYNASGLTYDAENDTVFYFDQGQIVKHKAGGQPEVIAYPPTSYIYGGVILDGEYFMADNDALRTFATDGSALPEQTLSIQGGYMDEVQRAFLAENPNVGIATVDEWYGSSEEIATAIKTGETGIDIFSVSATGGLYALINKGYAMDLSDSQIITEATDSYYPGYAHALKDENGRVCAVFSSVYAYGFPNVNVEAWEEFDLGDYPTTYSELIDLIALWEDEYADDHPDKTLVAMFEKRDLINSVINAYILQYENAPGGLTFNNPALREVLEKIEALEWENIDWENMTDADYEELNEMYQRETIISLSDSGMSEGDTYEVYSDEGKVGEYTIHLLEPLRFEEDVDPRVEANGDVFIINPESPNKELALRYLEYRVQHMYGNMAYFLDSTLTEPLRMEDFEETVARMEENLKRMQEMMEKADDVDKADYQYSIDYYTSWLADKEKNQWRISAEQVNRYHELAPYVYVPSDSLFLTYDGENTANTELYDMISRYADGQLTLDAFLREMDQKIRMIVLEGR